MLASVGLKILTIVLLSVSVAQAQEGFGDLPPPPPAPAAAPEGTPAATPAAPVATSVATPAAAPVEGGTADEEFDLRTKQLEEQVNDLKEKIFHSKRRLMSLQEVVMGAEINSGAKLVLMHRNELGSSYVLTAVAYTLDGAPLFTKVDDTGDLNGSEEFTFFEQRMVPGQHLMAVQYELRGHGYGIFSYLEGMRLKLRGSFPFTVEAGKITTVKAVLFEKDGITLEFKDKPDIRFNTNVEKDVVKPRQEEPAETPGPQASAGGVAQ